MIGGLIHFVCIKDGFIRSNNEIASFLKLHPPDIAKGIEEVHQHADAGNIPELQTKINPLKAMINTALMQLGVNIDDPYYGNKIEETVNIAIKKLVGIHRKPISKVFGATYYVLKKQFSADDISILCSTRKNTFLAFYNQIIDYEHFFKKNTVSKKRKFKPLKSESKFDFNEKFNSYLQNNKILYCKTY